MPIPSLNLGQMAGAVDSMAARQIGASLGRGTGRMMGRGTRAAVQFGAKAGMAGVGLGISVAATAAVGAVGVGYMAARTFDRMMNVPQFNPGANGGLPFVERGGSLFTMQKHGQIPFTNRHFWTPAFSNRFSNIIAGGALTAGMAGGVRDDYQSRNWNVTQALSTGALEVERDNFMGATGSLTLAMYKQRHGRTGTRGNPLSALEMQRINQMGAMETAVRHDPGLAMSRLNQDEIGHMAHMAGHLLR